jgi:hypothetical protein
VIKRHLIIFALAVAALAFWLPKPSAQMGPCQRDGRASLYCGEGTGAARIIPDTTSPSHQFALAWRLANGPPTSRPNDGDPNLESLIVRVGDGAILAKSHGYYWHLGDRYAPRQYLHAAWSPNSRLLIRTTGRVDVPDTAELFVFSDADEVTSPLDLVQIFDPFVRAQMKGVKAADEYLFRFCYRPHVEIDDQGLVHASVCMKPPNSNGGPIYELTARVRHADNSFDAKVLSISEYVGPSASVILHQPSDQQSK